ncbi:hypothetical protein KFU94_28100 [Chloroflexi bacterium TSY]|nr:hypothetical protein [Chloroflexi bacterium TSY]
MARNCTLLARLMVEQRLKTDPLVSRVYDPKQVADAYRDLIEHRDKVLGAIFDWTQRT